MEQIESIGISKNRAIRLVLRRQLAVGCFIAEVDGVERTIYTTIRMEHDECLEIVRRTELLYQELGVERPARISFEDLRWGGFWHAEPEPTPKNTENELLPCPHCGGKAKVFGEALMCSILCADCDGGFIEVGHGVYKSLLLKWNRRSK